MGQVYKVRNVISDRVEAMKVLLPDLVNQPDLADRFLREIKVQGSLEHPNIATLHTAVRVDNQLLMLMEFVEGITLDQKLKDGPLPVVEKYYRFWTTEPHLTPGTSLSRYYDLGDGAAPEVLSSEKDARSEERRVGKECRS